VRLVESARYLFWERGFAGTSMADLLEHAKVNSGSFYHFFESKEALLREVLQGYLHALRPMVVDPAFAATDEPTERIFAILAGYRERILMTESKYGCPLGRLALEIDPENRPAHKLIAENFQGWIGAVRECVDALKDRLPPETDSESLATYVLAVAAETYHVHIADEQEILGELSDIISHVYALDSALARVRLITEGNDEMNKAVARDLLAAFAPPAYSFCVHTARHILMDVCDPASLPGHLEAIGKLRIDWPSKVIAAKRRIARAVLEADGYPIRRGW